MSEYAGAGMTLLDQFIDMLARELTPLAPEERDKIITQYSKHFDECKACDMSDEAILARIGDPINLGRAYVAGVAAYPPQSAARRSAPGMAGMAVLLGFFSIICVYPVLVPVAIAMIAGVVASVVGTAASAISLLSIFLPPLQSFVSLGNYPVMANILICVGAGGACMALTIIFKSLSRISIRMTRRYTEWVGRRIRGY